MSNLIGNLYIVATPIGNLKDISARALTILAEVDTIVAEDTRHTKRLLEHYNISAHLTSLHIHNESRKSQFLIDKVTQGQSIALVSDAGTPLISDPGFPLVRNARQAGINIIPVAGCCALIAALSASGLPTDRFCFEGFLPAKKEARLNNLKNLNSEDRTLCFYEAPHRLLDSLNSMQIAFGGDRIVVVAKEISKSYERFFYGNFTKVISELVCQPEVIRGEFVIMVEGAKPKDHDVQQIESLMKILLNEKLPTKQAANITMQVLGCKKKEAYQIGLSLQDKNH